MSVLILDYLPFDYVFYTQRLLPAWRQALDGDSRQIKQLVASATRFSIWPYLNLPEKASKPRFEALVANQLGSLRRLYAIQPSQSDEVHLWDLFWPLVDAVAQAQPQPHLPKTAFLHACLLYTYCCDLPPDDFQSEEVPEEDYWFEPYYTPFIGNDDVPNWFEYVHRDETTRVLWEAFFRPLEPQVAQQFLFPDPYHPETYTHERLYRSLFRFLEGAYARPSSFITSHEVEQIVSNSKIREMPDMENMHSACIRGMENKGFAYDVEQIGEQFGFEPRMWHFDPWKRRQVFEELAGLYPELVKNLQQQYYERVWKLEARVMKRVHYAASRGWGLLLVED